MANHTLAVTIAPSVALTAEIVAVGPQGLTGPVGVVDVTSAPYLATGNGTTDDTTAIQAAITAAAGLRPVYLPPGTYRLNGTRAGTFNALLTYPTGTKIIGVGDASTLKVADSYTAGGDYRVLAPATAVDTSNVLFQRFCIDGNGANNLVAGSTGGNIRQAYMLYVDRGSNVVVDDVTFQNCPGRNVVVLGNNSNPPSITNGRVTNCRFSNVGGGISGNHLQNDHSTLYTQMLDGVVADNDFSNPAVVDPTSPAARVVTALEIHGSRTSVRGNRVTNFTHGGNAVAGVADSIGNTWVDNKFEGLTKLGVNIWTLSTFTHADLSIRGNVFSMYADLNTVLAGVYQSDLNSSSAGTSRNLMIVDNVFEAEYTTALSGAWYGVYLTAVTGGTVARNATRNTQGPGIALNGHTQAALNVTDVTIFGNYINNAGFHTLANRVWGVLLINAGTAGSEFHNIVVADNRITKPSSAGIGRGISIQGAGTITDVSVSGLDKVTNIANLANIATNTGSLTARVSIIPKTVTDTTAGAVVSGVWMKGDQLLHSDVAASGTLGKVCTTAGGSAQATAWAVATAYVVGQWVKTSGSKVMECIVAGTSHATTEPTPGTLGDPITDNTVTWAYRAANLAVFKTFGAVAA